MRPKCASSNIPTFWLRADLLLRRCCPMTTTLVPLYFRFSLGLARANIVHRMVVPTKTPSTTSSRSSRMRPGPFRRSRPEWWTGSRSFSLTRRAIFSRYVTSYLQNRSIPLTRTIEARGLFRTPQGLCREKHHQLPRQRCQVNNQNPALTTVSNFDTYIWEPSRLRLVPRE